MKSNTHIFKKRKLQPGFIDYLCCIEDEEENLESSMTFSQAMNLFFPDSSFSFRNSVPTEDEDDFISAIEFNLDH